MLCGTAYESATTILERTFKSKHKFSIKVDQSQQMDIYSSSAIFKVIINGISVDFSTSARSFEEASDELFELIKKTDIPDLWLPSNISSTVSEETMIVMSQIFHIKYITIGGLFYNKDTNRYAQEVTIHGNLDRYIFSGDPYRSFRKEVAEYFMDRYPEYLI